jgi:hypothetical protein
VPCQAAASHQPNPPAFAPSARRPRPQPCLSCSPEALSTGGICLPGTYTLTYTAANALSTAVSMSRRVVVYQAGRVAASFTLYSALEPSAGAALVAALRDASSAEAAAAADVVRARLAAAGVAVAAGDVAIDSAATAPAGGSSTAVRVLVNATVQVFYPPDVSRAVLAAAPGPRRRAQLRRRLIAGAAAGADDDGGIEGPGGWRALEVVRRVDALEEALQQHQAWQRCGNTTGAASACVLHAGAPAARRPAARRWLLQAGSGGGSAGSSLGAALSSVSSAMVSGLGASSPARASATPDVDVVGGYLSALASSVAFLEGHAAALGAAVGGVAAKVDQTFGAEAAQKDAALESQITTLYQVPGGPGWRWGAGGLAAGCFGQGSPGTTHTTPLPALRAASLEPAVRLRRTDRQRVGARRPRRDWL